ncbi:DUF2892 domain-containing protein [Candidatus Halobeggiatoa sp. HSG11]|nr:DUF2892 domain-containing protein [Candidatus Halobeggiatoa sp. HSG11]
MTVERIVFIIAGFVVMLSSSLSQLHNINWLWLTAFIGFMLFQSGFTGFCPLAIILKKMGIATTEQPS